MRFPRTAAAAVAVLSSGVAPTSLAQSLVYRAIAPCRIADTRLGGGALTVGVPRSFWVVDGAGHGFPEQGGRDGGCGVPGFVGSPLKAQVGAVMFNFVAVAQGPGNLRAWAPGEPVPNASIVNYAPGLAIANGIPVGVRQSVALKGDKDLWVRADVSATQVVIDVVGYFEFAPAFDANLSLYSSTGLERALNLRQAGNPALPMNPEFRLGRIVPGGDGSPEFRALYHGDDVPATVPNREWSVFEFDSKGIVASVKPPEVGTGRGSHFEGFIRGDSQPLFRLNSYPEMQLEMGPGGGACSDVALRRQPGGGFSILGFGSCAGSEVVQVSFMDGEVAPRTGFRQPGTGGERLKAIRGGVTALGAVSVGSGFVATHTGTGQYQISFLTPFTAFPVVQVTPISDSARLATVSSYGSSSAMVRTWLADGSAADTSFFFVATGVP